MFGVTFSIHLSVYNTISTENSGTSNTRDEIRVVYGMKGLTAQKCCWELYTREVTNSLEPEAYYHCFIKIKPQSGKVLVGTKT